MKKELDKNMELGENIKGTRAEPAQKKNSQHQPASATKREKYVKINWKSIECDVKIKFIRAANERAREIAMGIYSADSRGDISEWVYMDMIGSRMLFFVEPRSQL